MNRPNQPNKIIVHHTAWLGGGAQFASVNTWHKERGFLFSSLGWYVGYHYLIEKSGEVRQAKELFEEGCHTIGQNLTSIGVCLAGDFTSENPTARQRMALVELVDKLCARCGIIESEIYPHRTFGKTSCYGVNLSDAWARETYGQYIKKTIGNAVWSASAQFESLHAKFYKTNR